MARLTPENVSLAQQIIARYPRPKSATIPLCHLAQEQDGFLADTVAIISSVDPIMGEVDR